MSLPPHERQQLTERLDNLKTLGANLKRYQTRANCGPDEKHQLRDAEAAVNQAIPWVEKCITPPGAAEPTAAPVEESA